MRAAFYTLGCKVNQNETGALEEMFRSAGFTVVPAEEAADIFVVNSCTVTAAGDAKSRRALSRARTANPDVITVLTGCSPQAFPGGAAKAGADIVTGTAQRSRLLDNIRLFMKTKTPVVDISPLGKDQRFEELPAAPMPGRTRAFVKVQDGCNRKCAYCIIPTARGPARSRAEESVLEELRLLAGKGYAEVVFTGINLSSYGQGTGTDLAALANAAAEIPGIQRIRLSSMEPDHITEDMAARFAAQKKLCPHFHLSLQSGCKATLGRMRRPYTPESYAAVAATLRRLLPTASLTTDVIVGFPGESEEEFAESLAFVEKMEFLKVHVFPFSARAGTAAAGFPGQLPKAEKSRRSTLMQKAADAVRAAWIARQKGTRHTVLLETPLPDGNFTGYTENYIPVAVAAPVAAQGDIVTVELGNFDGERCACVLL
ncbi:tRNA (N(6)-L-threonylcarbamoyladenosine(37)-C(2))-methylthiotransferase MtaB [Clostridia bacterium OttesenSCG-928-O13]|nr:tRNA (N(6)-L-threonylcarbamoyladenosine(37)-C(2))-methylthiotransferase MtaB [Clostridia bacterium OttesenSCG-928-O13]